MGGPRGRPSRQGTGPELRVEESPDLIEKRRWPRRLLWSLGGTVAVLLVAYGALEYTQRPAFCVTCHYMEPYYHSWETSSHNKVNCLKCHYPPGMKGVLRAKVVAVSQVVQYLTRTYGSKPWAEVDDAACLRSGCHETRLLAGVVPFGPDGTIRFDHSHHLKDLKRGKQLRCTSCHAQIVQGQHLTVNPAACFLCHFKDVAWGQDLSRCQTCHDVSKIPPSRFNHLIVVRNRVDCRRCHGDITRGTGEVPKQHCLSCHNEVGRLSKYDDTSLIHTAHVTMHKVECSECHIEITHKLRKLTLADELSCGDCHSDTHRDQVRLFLGATRDDPHRELEPSPMYKVNVHCVGCHTTEVSLERDGVVRATTGESCDSCHQPGYGVILERWRELLPRALADTRQAISRASGVVGDTSRQNRAEAAAELDTARSRLVQVVKGHGVHNIAFALELLDEAQAAAARAMKLCGVIAAFPGVPEARVMRENECRLCHVQPPTREMRVDGVRFPHGSHVRAVPSCLPCHTPRSDHGKTTLTSRGCAACHGEVTMPHPPDWRSKASALVRAQGLKACVSCHRGPEAEQRCLPCHKQPTPDRQVFGVTFSHVKHLSHADVRCAACHGGLDRHGLTTVDRDGCTKCHGGVEMPHPENWVEEHPAWAGEHGLEACERCHAGGMTGEFCGTCHS